MFNELQPLDFLVGIAVTVGFVVLTVQLVSQGY